MQARASSLRKADTGRSMHLGICAVLQVLFYPTAIGSEPQDPKLDSYEHWTRVMCGHAGANLVCAMLYGNVHENIAPLSCVQC